jgi:hypothetical protein
MLVYNIIKIKDAKIELCLIILYILISEFFRFYVEVDLLKLNFYLYIIIKIIYKPAKICI